MRKYLSVFTIILFNLSALQTAMALVPQRFTTVKSHNDIYPYVLNNTKTTTPKISTAKTGTTATNNRRVVQRKTVARSANTATNSYSAPTRQVVNRPNTITVRSATKSPIVRGVNQRNSNPNIISRAGSITRARSGTITPATITYESNGRVSSQRCMSDYKECMESYCRREDTAYNRCYCSSKLAQIDSKYQNKIDGLIQQIVKLKYSNSADSDEIKEYWNQTVSVHTGTNPWVEMENALNIEWADMQSRIRGQNAFNTGHEYCVQHLRACSYMATNLRDAYKSEIARDCSAYEKSLQKIQEAAESVIESYND